MKKIIILTIVLVVNIFAIDTQALQEAHKEALKVYQSKDRDVNKSIEILNKAGISNILGKKPKNISKAKYIHILNDYGFFLYKAKNYEKALSFFRKVLLVNPDRTVTYLNTADNYKKMYEKTNSNSYLLNAIQYYNAYAEKIDSKEVSKEIQKFLDTNKEMKLVPLTENYILHELSNIDYLQPFKYLKEDATKFCQNFVKDAKNKTNIELIQAKLITNDLFDSKFVKLFPKNSEKLIISFDYRSNIRNNLDHHIGEPIAFYHKNMKEFEEWREKDYHNNSLRLVNIRFYDVDIDNNASNGKDKIVFAEGEYAIGKYFILDENLTKITLRITQIFKKVGYNIPREYLDEIIKYKNEYYVLNFTYNQTNNSYKVIDLKKLNKWNNINSVCKFTINTGEL